MWYESGKILAGKEAGGWEKEVINAQKYYGFNFITILSFAGEISYTILLPASIFELPDLS